MRSQRYFPASLRIDLPQLQRVILVAGEDDMSTIVRPVRLVVVAWGVGELIRLFATNDLAPERASHAVDQLLTIRRECQCRWTSSQLGQIHFAVVVVMRQLDLR